MVAILIILLRIIFPDFKSIFWSVYLRKWILIKFPSISPTGFSLALFTGFLYFVLFGFPILVLMIFFMVRVSTTASIIGVVIIYWSEPILHVSAIELRHLHLLRVESHLVEGELTIRSCCRAHHHRHGGLLLVAGKLVSRPERLRGLRFI